jgi:hypothetical protein
MPATINTDRRCELLSRLLGMLFAGTFVEEAPAIGGDPTIRLRSCLSNSGVSMATFVSHSLVFISFDLKAMGKV